MTKTEALELVVDPAPAPGEHPVDYVRRVTRSSGTSFYYAFLTLPRPRREAIYAVYAFCKAVDAAVDEASDSAVATQQIAAWRAELDAGFRGEARHPIAQRVGEAAAEFDLPKELFGAVIDGVAYDLKPRRFADFDELGGYCDLVAGAVGRLSVRIFGQTESWADEYADAMGRALQITNILRDIGPDAEIGRFYLPMADLERFGLSERDVLAGDERRLPLLRFEAERARAYFAKANELARRGGPELCAAEVMGAIYRKLLERVEAGGFAVTGPVARVPRLEKIGVAFRAWIRARLSRRRPS